MFALDANTLVYYFRGTGRVRQHLLATPPHQLAVPAVVAYEIELGIIQSNQPEKRRRQWEDLLAYSIVLPLDLAAAKRAAEIEASLPTAGVRIGPLDTLVAGIALASGCVLVTHNTREFQRVKGLRLLDWF